MPRRFPSFDSRDDRIVRWLFMRIMAIIYAIAFISWAVQVPGLTGSQGILPLADYLNAVREYFGHTPFWQVPTLCWISASDGFQLFLAWAGAGFSFLLFLNLAPRWTAFFCWLLYVSICINGQVFMGFQWDALLCETGLLAVLLAPGHFRPRFMDDSPPPRLVVWLLRWLLFRLMFSSGIVKLLSGDPAWNNLTALTYHYMTQPLPSPVSWYVHHWPEWFHRLSNVLLFIIEILVPFLIFFGRRARLVAFTALVFLQLLIIVTGNYCFFNLLTLGLCLFLLDDKALKRFFPAFIQVAAETPPRKANGRIWNTFIVLATVVIVSASSFHFFPRYFPRSVLTAPLLAFAQFVAPFRSVNSYGLFAIMTTKRPEIIIEGSRDGRTWEAYEFRWKPGALSRPPAFVAPYQPRVDWQMWFAALGHYRNNEWLILMMKRLLEGSASVTALLDKNPFNDQPPLFIRAVMYDYRFTSPQERRATGQWWERENPRPYAPVLSLKSFVR